ncbi:MAG TPA: TIGR03000 domain-containing protein [Gemmataceae bacterium]|jgi:uncharacterized protein (TIGR03000 family)
MLRRLSLLFGSAALVATLFVKPAGAHGPGGHHAGGFHYGGYYYPHHGYGFYGPYRPGLYAPYGFYRPYYPFGPALAAGGLGFGLGLGLGYGLGSNGLYRPYYGGTTIVNPTTVVVAPPAVPPVAGAPPLAAGVPPVAAGATPPQTQPPPDNAAHLQLVVPPNAEVVFNGDATTQTGATREFVSPPLTADKTYDYTILVRYTDANGKAVNDRRVIHVRANDWFRIDFTRPAPPEPLPAPGK